jgi:uncharacterized protein (TIGR03435 family)
MPLFMVLLSAYEPAAGNGALFTPDRLVGLPEWAMRDRYDITAKVAEEDLPEWQKPAQQKALLAERCKIAVHRANKETAVYQLVVGKGGPKFKETDAAAEAPKGMTMPGGAVMVPSKDGIEVHGATMGFLATMLSSMSSGGPGGGGRPVQDKTGLTGRYDLKTTRPEMGVGGGPSGGGFDPTETMLEMVESLGLKLEPGKAAVETLVVDHMEKPTAD